MGQYVATPNLSGISTAVLNSMFAAYQAELLRRMSGGSVQSGSSSGESFNMSKMTDAALFATGNALTDALGLDSQMTFVRPDFSNGTGLGIPSGPNVITSP